MYKKLIAMVLSLALVFCTGVPAFAASAEPVTEDFAETADASYATVSEDPVMPYGTVIPEITVEDTSSESETAEPETPAEDAVTEDEEAVKDENAEETDEEEEEETAAEKAERQAAIKYRNGLAAYMRKVNPKMGKVWSRNLAQTFIDIGEKYNLDPKVLMALAQRESSFSSKATSPYGYKGMMQTSDYLAKKYGYKPSQLYTAKVSIDVAARYLKSLKNTFGTYTMALCGYIYGGYAVKHGNYSKKAAWKIMNTRSDIQDYLEKWNFV